MAQLGQWDKAAADFARAVEWKEAALGAWHRHALLRLHLTDAEGYRCACAALLERFGKTDDPGTANTLAWVLALGPDGAAPARSLELAQQAAKARPKDYAVANTLGAALCRAGQHEKAIEALHQAMKLRGKEGTWADWLFLALAHHHAGREEEARQWLTKAALWLERDGSGAALSWSERLEAQLLHREAAGLLKPAKPE